jgi:hypothetical protein
VLLLHLADLASLQLLGLMLHRAPLTRLAQAAYQCGCGAEYAARESCQRRCWHCPALACYMHPNALWAIMGCRY